MIGFGILALLGWRGSAYWLAAGWALHPVWDVGLHYIGPGRSFTPVVWAISCITFDLVVATYILIAYKVIGRRTLRFRDLTLAEPTLAPFVLAISLCGAVDASGPSFVYGRALLPSWLPRSKDRTIEDVWPSVTPQRRARQSLIFRDAPR